MTIEFHCEHCNHLIRASSENAGQTGKCPHCGVETYIPRPVEDEELPLAPLDEEFEQHRLRAAREDAEYQRKLLKEQAVPGEKPRRRGEAPVATARGEEGISSKQLVRVIVEYLEAMSGGRLEQAEKLIGDLRRNKPAALAILDAMEMENLAGYGLPALPRPVLVGFLKQVRAKL